MNVTETLLTLIGYRPHANFLHKKFTLGKSLRLTYSEMSGHSPNLSPITLSDKDKLRGYENYPNWKILMEAHGRPKGLHKYWQNKITILVEIPDIGDSDDDKDAEGEEDPDLAAKSSVKRPTPTPVTPPSTKNTPLHSTVPLELEYELRESVALSSIIINGIGNQPKSKISHRVETPRIPIWPG